MNSQLRMLSAYELDAVAGGTGPSPVDVQIEIDVNKLIDKVEEWLGGCWTDACLEDELNKLVNKWVSDGLNLQSTIWGSTALNGVGNIKNIVGTDYYVRDSDGDGKWDLLFDQLNQDSWRVYDGKEWLSGDQEKSPWDYVRMGWEGGNVPNTISGA